MAKMNKFLKYGLIGGGIGIFASFLVSILGDGIFNFFFVPLYNHVWSINSIVLVAFIIFGSIGGLLYAMDN